MTISIWRYSHLALAVSSFLLLTLASVTGILLAFEPIAKKTQPYRVDGVEQLTLAQSLPVLQKRYPEITEISVDAHQFVLLKGSDASGETVEAYVNPKTGEILGTPQKQSEFFLWVTDLHRSLFLKGMGRFFVGLTAFLLLLITISGTILIIQRQRGIKRFFTSIVKDSFAQYYHVVLGRLSLIPIFILALTGTYLSLERFELIKSEQVSTQVDFDAIKTGPAKPLAEMAVFQDISMAEVESIEFPFSEDPEDYFTLQLKDREVAVNQITGDILSEVRYPTTQKLTTLSLDLHTGRTSIVWAIILLVASGNILFFIYSGFAITFKRRANRIKNKYPAKEARFILLVGSENGSTFHFAQAVYRQLLKQGKKPFLAELNQYTTYPKAEHILVFTATYGLGDAPTNAKKFATLVQSVPQAQPVQFSVVGFGSKAYPDFCQFAFEVHQALSQQPWATALVDVHTVNDRSPQEFSLWAEAWSSQAGLPLMVLPELRQVPAQKLETFTVTATTAQQHEEGTFLVRLKPAKRLKVTSGDLLAVYPENDHRERLYSVGLVDNALQVSVRLHPNGLGSGFLHRLTPGQTLQAKLVPNPHFHFPKKAPAVVMIANGTGIGPFLGMIGQNSPKTAIHLYCGFRSSASFSTYQGYLEEQQSAQRLTYLQVAFSREGAKQYVSDLIDRDATFIANMLSTGGVLMICGSLAMQKDVTALLETICQTKLGQSLSHYQSRGQLLTDCY
ncbi:FAD-binding oxidoreductase [Nibribacter ruber]|uniref:FAD-binding oxidoreductase n=1 Tax=Nibribacter ruber TaxID=2698458 RepID=A0A6P1P4B6_9BACT|nr:PepSY domain-containing protein [Nibribacter ruber]QHL89260.1 FAD-binding oxidoreductase [Nibribacter ruber]